MPTSKEADRRGSGQRTGSLIISLSRWYYHLHKMQVREQWIVDKNIGWKCVGKRLRNQQKSRVYSSCLEIRNCQKCMNQEEICKIFIFLSDNIDGHGEWIREGENGDSLL